MLKAIFLSAALLSSASFAKDTVPVKVKDPAKDSGGEKNPVLEKDTTEVHNDGPKKTPGSRCEFIQAAMAKKFPLDNEDAPLNYFSKIAQSNGALEGVRAELNSISEKLAKKDEVTNSTGASAPKSAGDSESDLEKTRRRYARAYKSLQKKNCGVFVDAKKSLMQFLSMLSKRNCSLDKLREAKKELSKEYDQASMYFDKDGCKNGNPNFEVPST